jgi:hypothetical protein
MDIEYYVCSFLKEASLRAMDKLPHIWWGTYNALDLYCNHLHYSPFLPTSEYMTAAEKEETILSLINRGIPPLS